MEVSTSRVYTRMSRVVERGGRNSGGNLNAVPSFPPACIVQFLAHTSTHVPRARHSHQNTRERSSSHLQSRVVTGHRATLKEKQRETERKRDGERGGEREIDRDGEREKQRERERERKRESETNRETETEREPTWSPESWVLQYPMMSSSFWGMICVTVL